MRVNENNSKTLDYDTTLQWDRQFVWHPYANALNPGPIYPVEKADGIYITLKDGRQLIDGMSSWWSAIHGYNHPVLNQAIQQQVEQVAHVMFGGLTHEPAVKLAKLLVDITPHGLDRVFFSDSGSVAMEVAIKMAFQYWISRNRPEKAKLATLKGGYHGDTFATMAICDPVNGMHHLFKQVLSQHHFLPRPESLFGQTCQAQDIENITALFQQHHHEIAAFVLEPIVQGTGGMHFYAADYLQQLRVLCDDYEILLIADEIATGFGRTGKLFACEHANITPDILSLGKSMTGGYISLAATLCTTEISNTISNGPAGAFMHGPTFMANPLATATALASISLLLAQPWQQNIERISNGLNTGLSAAKTHPAVKDVRVLGGIGVIELEQPLDLSSFQPWLVEQGLWLRPFGRLLYTIPPMIINDQELERLCKTMVASLEQIE